MTGTEWAKGTNIESTFSHNTTNWASLERRRGTFTATALPELSEGIVALGTDGTAARSMHDSVLASKQRTHRIISYYANRRKEFHEQYKCAGIR